MGNSQELVLRGRGRVSAGWSDGAVLVRDRFVEHRIPVQLIERVELRGRRVRLVLRADGASESDYLVRARSGPAATEFARAVRAAVETAGPVAEGAVRTVWRPAGPGRPARSRAGRLLALFLLCPVGLSIAAGGGAGVGQVVVGWFCGSLVTGFGVAVLYGALAEWRNRRLYLRGIPVTAELTEQELVDIPDQEPPHHQRRRLAYEFTDLQGVRRTYRTERSPSDAVRAEVELSYDPADPRLVVQGAPTAWTTVGAVLAVLLLGLPVTAAGLGLVGVAVAAPFVSL
ncbi:DUF3592 domain-containing protein [Kitasatospora purpeofusca]|uniref:DUF3592 domain-containing protein n=1 Tax=Kitasatospora purpeofusca TaxID=67352 RepID=UPI00364D9189